MKYLISFLFVYFLAGCSSLQETTDKSIPQLLIQYPLPEIPESIKKPPRELYMALYIDDQGAVKKVRFVKGSGSAAWDSLAETTIKRWKFLPARIDDQPRSTWYHIRAPIHYAIPVYFSLAEITCITIQTADSAYKALIQGQDFTELVMQYSVDSSRYYNGELGEMNIYRYPENIRRALLKLDSGKFTKPLKYANRFVIFKRIK